MHFPWLSALCLLALASAETLVLPKGGGIEILLELKQGARSRVKFFFDGELDSGGVVSMQDPSGNILHVFKNDMTGAFQFVPEHTGEYPMVVRNYSSSPMHFTFELPEAHEGPFTPSADIDPSKELEGLLKTIITSQQGLLARQQRHVKIARSIKGWIKKLTVAEVLFCLFVLYYVQNEVFRTFYSKKKV